MIGIHELADHYQNMAFGLKIFEHVGICGFSLFLDGIDIYIEQDSVTMGHADFLFESGWDVELDSTKPAQRWYYIFNPHAARSGDE